MLLNQKSECSGQTAGCKLSLRYGKAPHCSFQVGLRRIPQRKIVLATGIVSVMPPARKRLRAISALAVATITTLRMGQYPSVCARSNLLRLRASRRALSDFLTFTQCGERPER